MNYRSFNLGDWIGHISGVIEDESTLDGNEMRDLVEFLTTLVQEPKTGHWIRVTDKTGHLVWECDKCSWQQRFNTNFCPDCGAKMVYQQEIEV